MVHLANGKTFFLSFHLVSFVVKMAEAVPPPDRPMSPAPWDGLSKAEILGVQHHMALTEEERRHEAAIEQHKQMVKEEENLHKANIKRINASYYSQLTVDEITQENLKQMMSSKRPRDDADDNPGSSKRTHSDSDDDYEGRFPCNS